MRQRLRALADRARFRATHLPLITSAGRVGPERLVGLLMIRDETDVLRETLRNVTRVCDRIYVLDGTEPDDAFAASRAILDEFPEVKLVLRDRDTAGPFPIRDGARQYLLDAARRDHGTGHWIAVLHGDELFARDPRPFLARVDPRRTPVVAARLCHFFLHTDDRERWAALERLPVERRVTHYMWPGTPEDRFFFDSGRYDYDPARHSLVVPYPHARRRRFDLLTLKQYNYRTPEQMAERAAQRIESGWQRNHYEHVAEGGRRFVESLHVPGYEPCGWDNVAETDATRRSRPRSLASHPLPRLDSPLRPVFVGGPGRSGSTEVKRQLGRHPALVALRWEARFLTHEHGLLDLLARPSRARARGFVERMRDVRPTTAPEYACRVTENWGFRARNGEPDGLEAFDAEVEHVAALLADRRVELALRRRAAVEFVRSCFDRVALAAGAGGWVEQTPRNAAWAAELLDGFPDARFVHVQRDPRDVIASLLPLWWGPSNVAEAIPYYRERHAQWTRSLERVVASGARDRVVTLRLETLVAEGERGLDPVYAALGLEPHPCAFDAGRANIGRHRRELSAADLALIESELRPELAAGGYA